MTDSNQLPPSISHKQLKKLLDKASRNLININQVNYTNDEQAENFQNLLNEWADNSKKILELLNKEKNSILKNREQKSSMALGALEAHLTMAIHAFKASKEN